MKKLTSLFIACLLILSLTLPSFATGGLPKIVDDAGILTTYE